MEFLLGLILGIALALIAPRAWPLMRRYLPKAGAVLLLAVALARAADCPQPVVKIKGPCPNPCPQPAACPACVCNPAPSVVVGQGGTMTPTAAVACPPCQLDCTSCDPATAAHAKRIARLTEEVATLKAAGVAGHWFSPVTLISLPGWDGKLSYDERWSQHAPEDPAFAVSADRSWMVGAGLGYEWPSGWAVSGQAFRVFAGDTSSRWTIRPGLVADDEGPIRVSGPRASGPGDQWAFGATLSIPW